MFNRRLSSGKASLEMSAVSEGLNESDYDNGRKTK